jgi:hypothetical protein
MASRRAVISAGDVMNPLRSRHIGDELPVPRRQPAMAARRLQPVGDSKGCSFAASRVYAVLLSAGVTLPAANKP